MLERKQVFWGIFIAFLCLIVACTVDEPLFEPGTGDEGRTPAAANTPPPPTFPPTPSPTFNPAIATPFPSSLDEISLTATSAMATQHPELVPTGPVTPTPVPPSPGIVYTSETGLWQIGGDWQPRLLSPFAQARLSPDNTRLVYADQGDLWLTTLADGLTTQLTNTPDHLEQYPQWWAAQPDILLFQSLPLAESQDTQAGGYLSAMSLSEGWLTQLDRDEMSGREFAPSPNGLHIAYDRGGEPWLYHWDLELAEPFHEDAYVGSQAVTWARLGSPSWSADGNKVAWMVKVQGEAFPALDGSGQAAAAIFDMSNSTFTVLHPYDNLGRGGWFAAAVWSPDNQWLAFVAEDVDPARYGVWVVKTDGSEEHYLGPGADPVWSPDGLWLAFAKPGDTQGVTSRLVETASWYVLNLFVYDDGLIVAWRR